MSAVVKAIYKPLSLATSVLGGIAAAWCSNRFGSASPTTPRPLRTRKISTVVSEKY